MYLKLLLINFLMKDLIYLDNQATTAVDERVLAAMEPFHREHFGNPHSSDHVLGWRSAQAVEQAGLRVADLVGALPDEIVFTSGATEANNQAVLGAAIAARGGSKKKIVVSSIEHPCTLSAAKAAAELFGFTVVLAPVDRWGTVDLDWLQDSVDNSVLLVSVMAVNNEIGTIQDIARVSEIARGAGALMHSDCAQAPVALDLRALSPHVDMMSLSAHKIYGPIGIGALFVERSIQSRIMPIIYGGGQQRNLRSGTIPVPLVVGMGEATNLITTSEANSEKTRARNLRDRLVSGLEERIQISINTPIAKQAHPGNANICFKEFNANDILQMAQPRLAASTGSACTSGTPEPSHVLQAIGLSRAEAESSIRFSVGRFTSQNEIDIAIELLAEITNKLARTSVLEMQSLT